MIAAATATHAVKRVARLCFRWADVAALLCRTGRVPQGARLVRAEADADGRLLYLTLESQAFPASLLRHPDDLPVPAAVWEGGAGI